MKIKSLLFLVLFLLPGSVLVEGFLVEGFLVQGVLAQGTPPATPPVAGGTPAPDATEKPLQKLTPGVVASYGKFTMRGKALSQGLDDAAGEKDPSPVTGSVKHIGPNRCAAVLSNGSKEATFSVSFELSQSTKETIKSPKKKYFSAVLGPNKSVEREFRCDAADILQMSLKSGKEIRSK